MTSFSARFAGARPDEDSLERLRLRARLAARLIDGGTPPMRLGRYAIGEPIGAGAMGMVYRALDEELDRAVAIKILRVPDQPHDEPLREARALARLTHPNVIEVYDAGVHEGRVFIAMELVEGRTLAEWAASISSWSERLEAVLAAARGLAAVHRAGLVHRDVKPSNILVGADGRVRLMDFGLARARSEASRPSSAGSRPDASSSRTAPAGTPGFIAPEVLSGGAVDPRADQFSFAVTAARVLADAPARIGEALRRGMDPDPARRWPSVTALSDALVRHRRPDPLRRGAIVVSGLVAASVLGMAAVAWLDARAALDCVQRARSMADVYTDRDREAIARAVQHTGLPDPARTSDRLLHELDAIATDLQAAALTVCDAESSGRWSADLSARATGCLAETYGQLSALTDAVHEPEPQTIHRVMYVASSLARADACTDEAHLAHGPPPPPPDRPRRVDELRRRLLEIETLGAIDRWNDADAELERVWPQLVAAGWPPLLRAARLRRAKTAASLGELDRAQAEASAVYYESIEVADWTRAAEAAIELSLVVGIHRADTRQGLVWSDHAEVALDRSGASSSALEGTRLTYRAKLLATAGHLDEALETMQRAVEIGAEALDRDHPRVAALRGMLVGELAERGELERARTEGEAALADLERTLGPDHTETSLVLGSLAGVYADLGDLRRARDTLARAVEIGAVGGAKVSPEQLVNLAILESQLGDHARADELLTEARRDFEAKLGPDHPRIADTLLNHGGVQVQLKRYDEAMASLQRCLRIREETSGPDHPDVAVALLGLVDLATAMDEHRHAPALAARAAAIFERAYGADHPAVGEALLVWGANRLDAGDFDAARPLLHRARAIIAAHLPRDHPRVALVDRFIDEVGP